MVSHNVFMTFKEVFTLENYDDTTKFLRAVANKPYEIGYHKEASAIHSLRYSIDDILRPHLQLSQHLKEERWKYSVQADQIIRSSI